MNAPDQSMRQRLIAIVAHILEIDPSSVHGSQRLREDLGMDSLGSLELLSMISEQLKLDLEMEEAMDIVTVDDACAFVERQYGDQKGEARASAS